MNITRDLYLTPQEHPCRCSLAMLHKVCLARQRFPIDYVSRLSLIAIHVWKIRRHNSILTAELTLSRNQGPEATDLLEMSSLYNLEPQPTAKVLLETTSGDLLLELFAKQTPLTSRNFLQLCLDGYYNGTVFHRLVPGFIIQGGDPTGTGEGGEAIYDGGLFEDEFHSRLKFNRRGLLGMANSGRKNDNGSQFFLTLGVTSELQGKNTMFGRVEGETIYNLMKMAEADLMDGEGNERPLYPTKITGVEILVNPFEDMVRREKQVLVSEEKQEEKKRKKKANKKLLSFEADVGEDEDVGSLPKKPKFNAHLVTDQGGADARKESKGEPKIDAKAAAPVKAIRRKISRSRSPPSMVRPDPKTQLPLPNDEEPSRSASASPEPEEVTKVSTLLDRTNAQIADLKASMKRNIPTPMAQSHKKSALEQMIPASSMRGRKRRHGGKGDVSQDAHALNVLAAFRAKLDKASPQVGLTTTHLQGLHEEQVTDNGTHMAEVAEDDEAALCDLHFLANCQSCQSWDKQLSGDVEAENEDDKGWMSHALSFDKDRLGKDLNWKKKNEDDLVVIDPREKAKDIIEGQRAKGQTKSKTFGNKAWDRDRDRGRVPDRRTGERA